MRAGRGFTLLELIVVLAVLAALVGLLVPAIRAVQNSTRATKCLSNMRQLETAHWSYMSDHRGLFAAVEVDHCTQESDSQPVWDNASWVQAMKPYLDDDVALRSPLDDSPHWPQSMGGQGVPVPAPGGTDCLRWTSYGFNSFVTANKSPYIDPGMWAGQPGVSESDAADRLSKVRAPSGTVHFIIIAFEGPLAGSDHCDAGSFADPHPLGPPGAAVEAGLQVDAVSGPEKNWGSVANYGFLDGHVEGLQFSEVYTQTPVDPGPDGPQIPEANVLNRFDPRIAWQWAAQLGP